MQTKSVLVGIPFDPLLNFYDSLNIDTIKKDKSLELELSALPDFGVAGLGPKCEVGQIEVLCS